LLRSPARKDSAVLKLSAAVVRIVEGQSPPLFANSVIQKIRRRPCEVCQTIVVESSCHSCRCFVLTSFAPSFGRSALTPPHVLGIPLPQEREEPKSDPHNTLGMDARHSRFSLSSLYLRTTCKAPKPLEIAFRCRASTTGTTPRQNLQSRNPTFGSPTNIARIGRREWCLPSVLTGETIFH
jgi:hypothetical protein